MNLKRWTSVFIIAVTASTLLLGNCTFGAPPANEDKSTTESESKKPTLTVEQARRRAKLLHTTYEATLIAVHRAYFEEGERMTVPARVLEDVFYWVDEEDNGKTRWISVNTEAMNIDHEPDTEIEKQAAKALASGEDEYEVVDDGVYHRAGAVTLVASCLRCHESTLIQKRKRKRVAGLVISIPVIQEPSTPPAID